MSATSPSSSSIQAIAINGFGAKGQLLLATVGSTTPAPGQMNVGFTSVGVQQDNGAYSRGLIKVDSSSYESDSFLIKVDSFHQEKIDKVTLTLQARVQVGDEERIVVLAILAEEEVLNSDPAKPYNGTRTYRVKYADVVQYLTNDLGFTGLTLPPGTQLAVSARWPNGHCWGGFDRGGAFALPEKASTAPLSLLKPGQPAPATTKALALDYQTVLPKVYTEKMNQVYGTIFPDNAVVTTRLESEYKAITSESQLNKAVVEFYKMIADPKRAASKFGSGWTVKPVSRYWRKDDKGNYIVSPRLAPFIDPKSSQYDKKLAQMVAKGLVFLGDPDTLVDTYSDDSTLTLLRAEAAVRSRSNETKSGLLNIKPGAGRLDSKSGIRQRIEIGVELIPNAKEINVYNWLGSDGSYFNVGKQALKEGVPNLYYICGIKKVLDVTAERHRFLICNKNGVEVEVTFDSTTGKDARTGDSTKTITIYGFEAELNHLNLTSKNVSAAQMGLPTVSGTFTDEKSQREWAASVVARGGKPTLLVLPKLHCVKDLENDAFRKSDDYKSFEKVVANLVKICPPTEAGKQKAHMLAKALGMF